MTGLRSVALYSALLAAAMFGTGCEKTSGFCEDHPDDVGCGGNMQPDGNTGDGCTETCSGATPVCDKPNDECVVCLTDDDCSASAPVCSDVGGAHGNSCHGCESADDCDSLACLPSGQCAADTSVAYADFANGNDGNAATGCAKEMPCKTIATASTKKSTVVLLGETGETLNLFSDLTLLGGTGAVINNAQVTINGGAFTMAGVEVKLSGGACVLQQNGIVILDRVDLHNCAAGGLHVTAGDITVTRSSIHNNSQAGILFDTNTGTYNVSNTVVSHTTSSANSGGVTLAGASASKFMFNTIAFNQNSSGASPAAGVQCAAGSLANNIVVANTHAGGAASDLGAGPCTDTNNLSAVADITTLKFASDDDLSLTSKDSIAVDKTAAAIPTDNIGTVRPQGAMADFGAFEFKPPRQTVRRHVHR